MRREAHNNPRQSVLIRGKGFDHCGPNFCIATFTRTGSTISSIPERFSALSTSLLPSIPNPDRTGINSGLQSNKSPAISSVAIDQFLWAYTIDHNLNDRQNIHFSQWRDRVGEPSFTGAPIVPFNNQLQNGINNTQLGSGFLLNYVQTLNQNLVVTAGADWIGRLTERVERLPLCLCG